MTRIVYLHQYFNTRDGSSGTRSYEFAKRLASAGYDVHIVTSDRNATSSTAPWRVEQIESFTVHWLAEPYSNQMSFRRRILAFFRFAARSSRRARSLRGDVIFATSTPLTIAIPGIFAKIGRRIPMVFEVRDLWPTLPIAIGALNGRLPQSGARALERLAYRNAERIIALSPGMADGVEETGYPADRISVIPNASDTDLFDADTAEIAAWRESHPEYEGRKLVSYTGTFGLINGVSYLIDVAHHMQHIDPNIAFLLIGSGAEGQLIRDRAKKFGLLDRNVFIVDRIPKHEIPLVLGASTIVTSLFVPIKAMEANSANKFFDGLAAGKPIAINYGGWQRDILEANGAGFYLDPEDPASAAKTIRDVVNDQDELTRMAKQARKLAEHEFSRDRLADEFIAVMGSVLDSKARRPRG